MRENMNMPEAKRTKAEQALAMRRRTGLALASFALAMLGAAFAAVPLYQLFCQVTGYGGTTQRAEAPSDTVLDRRIRVRFDSTVAAGLQWDFKPRQRTIELRLGESALVYYEARSSARVATMGSATFNVTPEAAGPHFNKIECFCFSEQRLQPGESAALPLTFFVDPKLAEDPNLAKVDEITLSYTFFPRDAGRSVVESNEREPRAGT